jgi:hypothetical protein
MLIQGWSCLLKKWENSWVETPSPIEPATLQGWGSWLRILTDRGRGWRSRWETHNFAFAMLSKPADETMFGTCRTPIQFHAFEIGEFRVSSSMFVQRVCKLNVIVKQSNSPGEFVLFFENGLMFKNPLQLLWKPQRSSLAFGSKNDISTFWRTVTSLQTQLSKTHKPNLKSDNVGSRIVSVLMIRMSRSC